MKRKYLLLTLCALFSVLFIAQTSYAYTIMVRPQEAIVEPGAGMKFDAQAFNENHVPVAVDKYEWKVAPKELGIITEDGFFIAGRQPGKGEVIATATIGGEKYSGTAHVTVGAPDEQGIKIQIQPNKAIVPPNGNKSFKAIAVGPDGVSLRVKNVRWMVKPSNLGKIDRNGVFKAGNKVGAGAVIALVEIDHQVYTGEAAVVVSKSATASIAGNVTDESGAALADVRISVSKIGAPPWFRRAKTDTNGNYLIEGLIPGYYIVRAEKKGYVPEYYDNVYYLKEAMPVNVDENEAKTDINFVLDEGGSISGTIVAEESGEPLKDVHVAAFLPVAPNVKFHTLTDDQGNYKLTGLLSGYYIVAANKAGYLGEMYDDARRIDQATPVQVTMPDETTGIDFALGITSAITGVITSEVDGSPIEGATVGVTSLITNRPNPIKHFIRVTKTNENGEYSLQVPAGYYLLVAKAKGFAEEWYEDAANPADATPVQVQEDQHTEINMALSPLGSITGLVVDEQTGEPIAGAKVNAYLERKHHRRFYKAVTGEDGTYTLANLPAGNYIVEAHAEGYLPEFWQEADSVKNATLVTVENNSQVTGIDFTLSAGAKITGTVTDEDTGQPIADAFVKIKRLNGHLRLGAKTDENGNYEIGGLPAGTYIARAAARGYMAEWYQEAPRKADATPIDITGTETVEGIDFTLTPRVPSNTGITGIVIDDSTGLPIEGAVVAVMPLTWAKPKRTVTGPDGTFELLGLKPGIYIAVAWAEGYIGEFYNDAHRWFKATPITVQAEQITSGIDFGLQPKAEGAYYITGMVLNPDGEPIEGALVLAKEDGQVVASTLTEEDGTYELENMPAGSYKLEASATSYEDAYYAGTSEETAAEVNVGEGENFYSAVISVSNTLTGVEEENSSSLPTSFKLDQNYPNPFNPTTEISFSLPEQAHIRLTVYNILGKEIKTLYNGMHDAGSFTITWDGTNDQGLRMSSGVYIYRLEADVNGKRIALTRRMAMLK